VDGDSSAEYGLSPFLLQKILYSLPSFSSPGSLFFGGEDLLLSPSILPVSQLFEDPFLTLPRDTIFSFSPPSRFLRPSLPL